VNTWINLHALWRILVVGMLAGAGLPAIFAIGLRALSAAPHGAATTSAATAASGAGGSGIAVADESIYGGNPLGLVAACLCFAVVLAAVGWGIYSIVAGA
jgi:hypothetical protein